MDCDLTTIPLDRIQTTDRTFQITTDTEKTDLTPSIGTVGLMQPPVLLPKERGWAIVCGRRRIEACAALKIRQVSAWTLPADCTLTHCVRLAVADNALQRQLNVVEQARALALIQTAADPPESSQLAAAFDLPATKKALDRIVPVAAMQRSLQDGLLTGQIALPIALKIHQMNGEDARELATFFLSIMAGLNVQRELHDTIVDICRRDRISIGELMQTNAIATILNERESPMNERVHRLRRHLKKRRFPQLSQAEDRYRKQIQSLQLASPLQLQPPPFFEGRTYRISFSMESKKQLKALKADLDRLIEHPSILPER